MRSGVYAFQSFNTEQNTSIEFDLTDGAVLIDVVKSLNVGEGSQMKITSSSGGAELILFRVGGGMYLMKGGTYLGSYLALSGDARLGQDAQLTGALYGKMVHIMNRARIVGKPGRDLYAYVMLNHNLPFAWASPLAGAFNQKIFLPVVVAP